MVQRAKADLEHSARVARVVHVYESGDVLEEFGSRQEAVVDVSLLGDGRVYAYELDPGDPVTWGTVEEFTCACASKLFKLERRT